MRQAGSRDDQPVTCRRRQKRVWLAVTEEIEYFLYDHNGLATHEYAEFEALSSEARSSDVRAPDVCRDGIRRHHLEVRPRRVVVQLRSAEVRGAPGRLATPANPLWLSSVPIIVSVDLEVPQLSVR